MPQRDDPYLQPNGTLRNKLGITDQALLSLAEADLVAARAKLLELNLPRPPFSFDTLKAIHHELFQDVYTWAGQARATQIGKREYDDPTSRVQMFAAPDTIEARANALFRSLTEQNFLAGTSRDGFAAGATAVFAELNAIHFAREGNGRTNRLLLSAMAADAGHTLAFDVITRERMIAVSVAAHEGDPSGVRRMFDEILDPRQVKAMRKAWIFCATAPCRGTTCTSPPPALGRTTRAFSSGARERTSCCGLGTATIPASLSATPPTWRPTLTAARPFVFGRCISAP